MLVFHPGYGLPVYRTTRPKISSLFVSAARFRKNAGYQNLIPTSARSLPSNPVTGCLFIERCDPKIPLFVFQRRAIAVWNCSTVGSRAAEKQKGKSWWALRSINSQLLRS
jgi:hypothetical protein